MVFTRAMVYRLKNGRDPPKPVPKFVLQEDYPTSSDDETYEPSVSDSSSCNTELDEEEQGVKNEKEDSPPHKK
jgi:hypothetical protein